VAVLVLLAALTAGAVALAGGGTAVWLCLPSILFAASRAPTRRGAVLSAAVVLGAASLPSVVLTGLHPLPSAPLVLAVVASSVAVLLAARARWERERDVLRRSALSDQLTGIGNRRLLIARIQYEIARHERVGHGFALVMIDLDGFKAVNDRFGHGTGDDLLRDVGQALERTIRAQDTAARIGGDEFCVLAPETDGPGTERLVDRVVAAVGRVTLGTRALAASAGVAVFPEDGTTPDALLEAADQRLIAAKRSRGRARRQRRAA
jgi:diguanylate cyclase (GGDEF)-like protein